MSLDIIDSCETSTLNGSITLEPIVVSKGESLNIVQTNDVLTDSISDDYMLPENCGEITYEVLDAQGGAGPDFVKLVYTQGDSTFSLEVDGVDYEDDAPVTLDLVVEAKLIDYVATVASLRTQFTVTVLDPCETAVLTGSLAIEDMTAQGGESEKFVQTVDVLSDSVSDAFSVPSNCGSIEYEVLDAQGDPAPDYVSIVYSEGDPAFDIEVDVKDYEDVTQTLQLYVKAKLNDYSQVPSSTSAEFNLEILEAEPFVFVPPPPPPEPKPEQPPPVIIVIEASEPAPEPV